MYQEVGSADGHGIRDCPHQLSIQEQAGMDLSVWYTR